MQRSGTSNCQMDCNRRIQCWSQSRLVSDDRSPASRKRLTGDSLGGLEWLCQMDRSDKVAEGCGSGLWYDAVAWEMFEVFCRVPQPPASSAGPTSERRRKSLTSEHFLPRTASPALVRGRRKHFTGRSVISVVHVRSCRFVSATLSGAFRMAGAAVAPRVPYIPHD